MLENARKIIGPLVLMNRHIKVGVKGTLILLNYMCDKKGSLLLRTSTRISKFTTKNSHVLNSRYLGKLYMAHKTC